MTGLRSQIWRLGGLSSVQPTCHPGLMMVTSVCIAREDPPQSSVLYCALYCTVSLYCTVRGLDVTLAMICDWRGEARNGSGDYSPAINITTPAQRASGEKLLVLHRGDASSRISEMSASRHKWSIAASCQCHTGAGDQTRL